MSIKMPYRCIELFFLILCSTRRKFYLASIWIEQHNWIPSAVRIGRKIRILVRQWVDAQPAGQKLVVHIAGTEISVAGFLIAFFAGGNKGVNPQGFRAVLQGGFMC